MSNTVEGTWVLTWSHHTSLGGLGCKDHRSEQCSCVLLKLCPSNQCNLQCQSEFAELIPKDHC